MKVERDIIDQEIILTTNTPKGAYVVTKFDGETPDNVRELLEGRVVIHITRKVKPTGDPPVYEDVLITDESIIAEIYEESEYNEDFDFDWMFEWAGDWGESDILMTLKVDHTTLRLI